MEFKLITTGIDTSPIINYLNDNPYLWDIHTVRQNYPGSAHKDTETIFLRGPSEFTAKEYQGTIDAFDYEIPLELEQLTNFIYKLGDENTKFGYIMFTKLKAGGFITPHIDEGVYSDYYSRFHLVIDSDEGNIFTCGDENIHMKNGEIWQFNHKHRHMFSNESNRDRIHLIFDAKEI